MHFGFVAEGGEVEGGSGERPLDQVEDGRPEFRLRRECVDRAPVADETFAGNGWHNEHAFDKRGMPGKG